MIGHRFGQGQHGGGGKEDIIGRERDKVERGEGEARVR